MRESSLKRSKRGFVRTVGPRVNPVKFYLGHDRDDAEVRLAAILAIWSEIEDQAEQKGLMAAWDKDRLGTAKAIAKGERAKIVRGHHETAEGYFKRVAAATARLGVPIEPANRDAFEIGRQDMASGVTSAQDELAQAIGSKSATGQNLHEAIDAFMEWIRSNIGTQTGYPTTTDGRSWTFSKASRLTFQITIWELWSITGATKYSPSSAVGHRLNGMVRRWLENLAPTTLASLVGFSNGSTNREHGIGDDRKISS
jgi:hypothetical protein